MNIEQYNQVVAILEDYSSTYGEVLLDKLEKLPKGDSKDDQKETARLLKPILEEFRSSLVKLFGKIAKTGAEMEYLDDVISHTEQFVGIVFSICRKEFLSPNLFGVDIQPREICIEQFEIVHKEKEGEDVL